MDILKLSIKKYDLKRKIRGCGCIYLTLAEEIIDPVLHEFININHINSTSNSE